MIPTGFQNSCLNGLSYNMIQSVSYMTTLFRLWMDIFASLQFSEAANQLPNFSCWNDVVHIWQIKEECTLLHCGLWRSVIWWFFSTCWKILKLLSHRAPICTSSKTSSKDPMQFWCMISLKIIIDKYNDSVIAHML